MIILKSKINVLEQQMSQSIKEMHYYFCVFQTKEIKASILLDILLYIVIMSRWQVDFDIKKIKCLVQYRHLATASFVKKKMKMIYLSSAIKMNLKICLKSKYKLQIKVKSECGKIKVSIFFNSSTGK